MIPPKIIHQVWVGDKRRPVKWMQTWQEKHPGWLYVLWDNDKILNFPWRNWKHMRTYWNARQWHGVADMARYEILYSFGGFVAPADSECLLPIDELLDMGPEFDCFSCLEEEGSYDRIVPVLCATPGNELVGRLITGLHEQESLGPVPWIATGNGYMAKTYKSMDYKRLKFYPFHYFVPEHHQGAKYTGNDKIYCRQYWGTTNNLYEV